jgi:hypothetical protein
VTRGLALPRALCGQAPLYPLPFTLYPLPFTLYPFTPLPLYPFTPLPLYPFTPLPLYPFTLTPHSPALRAAWPPLHSRQKSLNHSTSAHHVLIWPAAPQFPTDESGDAQTNSNDEHEGEGHIAQRVVCNPTSL